MKSKFLIVLIIFLLANQLYSEKKCANSKQVENKKEKMFPLKKIKKIVKITRIEISILKKKFPKFKINYNNISNYIHNNGRKIWQDNIDLLKNKINLNDCKYTLSRIEWSKSKLTWKGKDVGLELRLIHHMVQGNRTLVIIFPLSLVDVRIEDFVGLSYNNQKTNKATLNSLITKVDQIPNYVCCHPSVGPIVNFNLCSVENLITKQKYFYKHKVNETETWLISRPQLFSRHIGLNIRNKLVV